MKRNDFILSLKQGFNMEYTLEPIDVVQFDNCNSVYSVVWRLFDVPKVLFRSIWCFIHTFVMH
jgi:hypothetical protein